MASAVLLALCVGCGPVDEETMYESLGPRHEAREWLAGNENPYAFASNRFGGTAAAAAFIDTLYALGADTVYVANVLDEEARIAEEGGPYADALLVLLPAGAEARGALFLVGAREARHEGFEPELDRGQRYLFLWWD
jgi:hypothetical protein